MICMFSFSSFKDLSDPFFLIRLVTEFHSPEFIILIRGGYSDICSGSDQIFRIFVYLGIEVKKSVRYFYISGQVRVF